ncbi:hypothetical protein DFH09DRAFT_1091440 [Mycena vulgaris]|nr:hypothetical protein DFH09DRAFT_1091440 [Mycena vulgaris]
MSLSPIESLADVDSQYTRIKKDIFHAFHMIPIPAHGLRAIFSRTLRDHIMRWDPVLRVQVDEVCRREFNASFDVMLIRDPQWIKEHVPRYIPPPSVLVPAIQHVYNVFGNAPDAETGRPLFDKKAWEKANAVLELAREGYLSDIEGVVLYEKAGLDEYGLWRWVFRGLQCPRLTVNSLAGHRTRYNPQAFAKHQFGVNWDYHYTLEMLNRTSFLLNYLSDVLDGASSYSDWMNTDLYERTKEKFGVCPVPETLRTRLDMASYSPDAASKFELNTRSRITHSFSIVESPTTLDARKYFFTGIRKFAGQATTAGKKKIDFEAFAREWNSSADGKTWYCVTGDVLSTYAKTWQKISNIRASQDLIAPKIDLVRQTGELFSAATLPFPESLKGNATATQPHHDPPPNTSARPTQSALATKKSNSIPQGPPNTNQSTSRDQEIYHGERGPSQEPGGSNLGLDASDLQNDSNMVIDPPHTVSNCQVVPRSVTQGRRRAVPENERKNKMRTCRRCRQNFGDVWQSHLANRVQIACLRCSHQRHLVADLQCADVWLHPPKIPADGFWSHWELFLAGGATRLRTANEPLSGVDGCSANSLISNGNSLMRLVRDGYLPGSRCKGISEMDSQAKRTAAEAPAQPWQKDIHQVGKATCPKCGALKSYGPGEVPNLEGQHLNTAICVYTAQWIQQVCIELRKN